MKTTRQALLDALAQLSVLYPTMRFGQTLEMLATLAGAESVSEIERTSDALLLQAAHDHIADRAKQLELQEIDTNGMGPERRQLLAAIPGALAIDEPLTQAAFRLAIDGGTTLYDVEDEFLISKLSPETAVA